MRHQSRGKRVFSSVSDEMLAMMIAEDYRRVPSEFSIGRSEGISDASEFLANTSARGISPMKKWL